MSVWIFDSQRQRDQQLALIKCAPCPHCRRCGALNRHGYLKGYAPQNTRHKIIRALRVYCSNRGNAAGCGRTFSLWVADKVKRLFLNTKELWEFLQQKANTGNTSKSFKQIHSPMTGSAAFRIWKRFLKAQSTIRTTLCSICQLPQQIHASVADTAPSVPSDIASWAQATIAHLKEAFKDSTLNPIAAYQVQTQRFFI